MSYEYDDQWEEFDYEGKYYQVKFSVVIYLENIDCEPGPFNKSKDFGVDALVYHIQQYDEDGELSNEIAIDSELGIKIKKSAESYYEPEEYRYNKAYEYAEEDHYANYEEPDCC